MILFIYIYICFEGTKNIPFFKESKLIQLIQYVTYLNKDYLLIFLIFSFDTQLCSPRVTFIYGQSGSLERQDVFCTEFDISVKKHFVGGRCWLRRPLLVPTTCSFFIQCIPHIVFTLFDPVRGLPSTCPKTGHELLSPTLPAVLKSNPPGKEDRKITSQGEI